MPTNAERAQTLIHALPYIQKYAGKIVASDAAISGNLDNYDITYVAGKLTITKAALTIIVPLVVYRVFQQYLPEMALGKILAASGLLLVLQASAPVSPQGDVHMPADLSRSPRSMLNALHHLSG